MSTAITAEFVALQTALAGRYSIEGELGRGGMGVVYLAHEIALDRPVALKVLPTDLAADTAIRERFLQEARTAAKLSHPNIVPIHAVDEVDQFVFFAMAFVSGETLGERVRSRGPLSDAEAFKLLKEVAWALDYAHTMGVVHRDVKPDNILIEAGTGRALVTDFGIAQMVSVGEVEALDAGPDAKVMGTAEFMSPEQAQGATVDGRSDLYCWGAVGFYALAGRAPFEHESPAAVLGMHVSTSAPPLASVMPYVPTQLAIAVDRCLRKDPSRRFETGGEIADALSRETAGERVVPVPLRVFNKKLREFSTASMGFSFFFLLFIAPSFLGMLFTLGLVGLGWAAAVAASVTGLWTAYLAYQVRRLLKGGHTLEDLRHALANDVRQRNEEYRFEFGARTTWVDRLAKRVAGFGISVGTGLLGVGGIGMAVTGGIVGPLAANAFLAGAFSLVVGLSGLLLKSVRAHNRADLTGERWLKFWRSGIGARVFKLAGIGLKRARALTAGTHRPTEMAISISAVRLWEELPKDVRKSLGDVPKTLERLEEDARRLREQVAELDAVLVELGETGTGDEMHAQARREVQETREAVADRLKQVMSALESVRLGLLRLHAGERVQESMTAELAAAGVHFGDMSDLLEGRREVERMLAERRATGTFTIAHKPITVPPSD